MIVKLKVRQRPCIECGINRAANIVFIRYAHLLFGYVCRRCAARLKYKDFCYRSCA